MCFYNGEQFNSDTARIINKFDIYVCDLGEIGESNTLGKSRPCVIISSNEYNSPKNGQYIIAPIRTEHQMEVSRDTLETIVKERRKLGRIYVPIEMAPDDFRFIDISQMRQISNTNVVKYSSTVINENIRKRINDSIFELIFSQQEATEYCKTVEVVVEKKVEVPVQDDKVSVEETEEIIEEPVKKKVSKQSKAVATLKGNTDFYKTKTSVNNKTEEKVESSNKKQYKTAKKELPNGFSLYYRMYINKKITAKELAIKCNISLSTLYRMIKEFESTHPDLVGSMKK